MTDIVERLRNSREISHWPMIGDAADEIARLRANRDQLIAIAADEMRKRDAEIERLRAKAERFGIAYENEVVVTRDLCAEIERLRQDVNVVHADICAENDNMRAEIERLRDLLADTADQRDKLMLEYGLFQLPDKPRDDGTAVAVGGEPGASAGKSE